MEINVITNIIEAFAPLALQEDYDNAGLIVGSPMMQAKGVLLSLDITEDVIDEAISLEANLIISHHPLIFNGIKKITGSHAG